MYQAQQANREVLITNENTVELNLFPDVEREPFTSSSSRTGALMPFSMIFKAFICYVTSINYKIYL